MDNLCKRLFEIEPIIDLAHEVAGCGKFSEIVETSDGFFLGRPKGAIGFDVFLGQPTEIAKKRTQEIFDKLTPIEKVLFCSKANQQKIIPADIGINCKKSLFEVV